jgi:hypothetical protein
MNQLNRSLASDVESVYLMAGPQYSFFLPAGSRRSPPSGATSRASFRRRSPAACRKRWGGSETGSTMDVLVLIDKLDDLVHNAKLSR